MKPVPRKQGRPTKYGHRLVPVFGTFTIEQVAWLKKKAAVHKCYVTDVLRDIVEFEMEAEKKDDERDTRG